MLALLRITEIFCSIYDFYKEFVPFWHNSLLAKQEVAKFVITSFR